MATTTTNFGWDIPQSTDLVKDGATAIAALGQDIDTALVDLKGGTTGQVLAKASATDLDYSWVTTDDTNAIQNAIVDAKGDLIAATGSDTPARLPVGANDLLLTAASGETTGLKYTGGWTTFTPTFTNFTLGNGTVTGRYQKIGKTVNYFMKVDLGSTSSVTGRIIWTLPVEAANAYATGLGAAFIVDAGTAGYVAFPGAWSSTQSFLSGGSAGGAYLSDAPVSATVPMTWTTNDFFFVNATYEVA